MYPKAQFGLRETLLVCPTFIKFHIPLMDHIFLIECTCFGLGLFSWTKNHRGGVYALKILVFYPHNVLQVYNALESIDSRPQRMTWDKRPTIRVPSLVKKKCN